jgi:hypothetical protein
MDLRDINRRAVKNWDFVRDHLIDRQGRSLVRRLNPSYVAPDPNRMVDGVERRRRSSC